MVGEPMRPDPDEKDWTWVMQRPCPDCGFDPTGVEPVSLPALIGTALSDWPAVLARPDAALRPAPQIWSPLEYACHVRDVLRLFAERLHLMLDRDTPTFANWDQDATAVSRRYWEQDPARVGADIATAGEAAAVAFGAVRADQWRRRGIRSNGSEFTVETLGVYFLHDLQHHQWDVRTTPPSSGH
ncbi:MAG: DinB family protein [Dermatophilaceae bacterium]